MAKLSIAVASHSARYLPDLAKSLSWQSRKDWEAVILTNGGLRPEAAEAAVKPHLSERDFSKVRVIPAKTSTPTTIGALKREAFGHVAGEIIVELDHDDLLLPECLSEVVDAFEETGADFVYSNMAPFYSDNWDGEQIWFPTVPTRPFRVFGRTLHEGITEPVTPHLFYQSGMASIFHVRAWKRDFYEKLGGHNPKLSYCDDYELVIRSYLADGKFHHIDRCLYLYRVERRGTDSMIQTSSTLDTALARRETDAYRADFIVPVLRRWCRDQKLDFVSHPGMFNCAGEAGAILVSSLFELPLPELLQKAHHQLVHGGWLVTTEPMPWSMADVMKFTRPKYNPTERFQELTIHDFRYGKTPEEICRMNGVYPLTVRLAAKKKDVPLGGSDFWHPRVNATDLRVLKPIFEAAGCQIRFEGERLRASGPSDRLHMAMRVVSNLSPVYQATIKTETENDDEGADGDVLAARNAADRATGAIPTADPLR